MRDHAGYFAGHDNGNNLRAQRRKSGGSWGRPSWFFGHVKREAQLIKDAARRISPH